MGYSTRRNFLKTVGWGALGFSLKAALKDREIESRVRLFSYRIPEEFYNLDQDPDSLENLIQDPQFSDEIEVFRKKLEAYMAEAGDPALEAFRHRENPD